MFGLFVVLIGQHIQCGVVVEFVAHGFEDVRFEPVILGVHIAAQPVGSFVAVPWNVSRLVKYAFLVKLMRLWCNGCVHALCSGALVPCVHCGERICFYVQACSCGDAMKQSFYCFCRSYCFAMCDVFFPKVGFPGLSTGVDLLVLEL